MAAYGIIVVCLLIMLVYLLLRVSLERFSNQHRLSGSSGSDSPVWSTYSHGHHGRQSHRHRSARSHKRNMAINATGVDAAEDVATLQNNQNIYKSRTSLSTDKVPFSDVVDNSISDTCSSASSDVDGPLDAYHVVGHHPASSRSLRLPYAQHHHYHHGPYAAYHPVPAPPQAAHSSPFGHYHAHRRHHHRGGAMGHRAPPSHAYSVYNLSSAAAAAHNSASVHHLNDYLSYSTNQSIALAQHQPPPPPYASISAQTGSARDATYGRSLAGQSTSAIYHPASMCLPSLYSNAGLGANKSNSQVYGQLQREEPPQPQQQQQQQQQQSTKPNEQP